MNLHTTIDQIPPITAGFLLLTAFAVTFVNLLDWELRLEWIEMFGDVP